MSAEEPSGSKKSKKPAYHGSRTIKLLEADGWQAHDQTERIVRQGGMMVRQDLFGFGDRLAMRETPQKELMLIQETGSGSSPRLKKIAGLATPVDKKEASHFAWVERCAFLWLETGSAYRGVVSGNGLSYFKSAHRIQVWSWRKFKPVRGGKQQLWKCVRYEVVRTLQDGVQWFEVDQVLPDGLPISTKKR